MARTSTKSAKRKARKGSGGTSTATKQAAKRIVRKTSAGEVATGSRRSTATPRSRGTAARRAGKGSARTSKTAAAKAGAKPVAHAAKKVLVVNMIPRSLSGESNQDSEPTLTVNPANPLQIAASAFTPDPAGGNLAPIYVSNDGGLTWSLNSIVPSSATHGSMTADITVAFSSKSNRLYAGIIRLPFPGNKTRLNILRTSDFQGGSMMDVLVDRTGQGVDQPYVQAVTVATGPDAGKDRVYVGDNDFNSPNKTATIDQSLDAGKVAPVFASVRIEKRATSGQDGPPVRPAVHPDGTVYAVFHSWRSFNPSTGAGVADVVLVRDDHGGTGPNPFTALVDSGDGKVGARVAQNVAFNFDGYLGLQRTGGDVAVAVDPTDSNKVYVAYNADENGDYMLHVSRSQDRGATWSADIRRVRNALNPALAVNSAGKLGLLYQQLTGNGPAQRWVTKFESTTNGSTWATRTLANTPADNPPREFDPYLGDYDHLRAVGKDFYGIFSASNLPRKSNFPQGVTYLRNANFATNTLLDVDNATPVRVSIDPFFFKVTG